MMNYRRKKMTMSVMEMNNCFPKKKMMMNGKEYCRCFCLHLIRNAVE